MATLPFPRLPEEPGEHRRTGRYLIEETLGRGSMGVVYLATDPLIGRQVALKTLSPDHPLAAEKLESLRRHLLNEAASAGALNHPGIVTIHDVVDHGANGQISVAMEYVPGETLKQRLARPGTPSLERISSLVSQIAEVLDFAHSQGVVHRDIKPANVILTDDGKIKITDFGIASLRGRDLAHDLEAMGTPNYLAPERLLGQEADFRADVYSLGVLLYEMLTRHLPFQGETLAELVRNTVQDEFTPPEIFRPDLLPELRTILERALAKEPDNRYQSAGELAAELRAVLQGQEGASGTQPITRVVVPAELLARPAEPAEPAVPPAPKKRTGRFRALLRQPRLLAGGLVAIAAVALGLALLGRFPVTVTDPAATLEQQRKLAYLALLDEVQKLYEQGDTAGAERLIAEAQVPEANRLRELRQEAWWNAETERVTLRVAQVVELLEVTGRSLARRDLATADRALYKIKQLDPGNPEAAELRSELARIRWRIREAARRSKAVAAEPEPVIAEAPRFQAFEIEQPPAPPAADPFGRLKIDFQSALSRGVVTIYAGADQILRREYNFFEKRKFLRRRQERSGGFDTLHRLPAGPLDLKVYLSGPDRPAELETLAATLPGGTVRTLTVRVGRNGELALGYH